LAATVGVLVALVFSRRADRLRKALDLYERYNSTEIIDARNKAWRYLSAEYNNEPIWDLYSDKGQVLAGPLYAATVAALEKQGRGKEWQEFRYMEDPAMSWLAD
jgi:hypothetical protein